MPLVDNYGREVPQEDLAACLASDLRTYTNLSREEIDARLWKHYPGVMRRWELEDREGG
jgi:hypothetical protein